MKRFFNKLCTLPGIILLIATIFYLVLIVCSFSHYCRWENALSLLYLNKTQLITYGIGLIAATVVYFQIVSLQEQLAIQTLIDYNNQWNSSAMVLKRKTAMNVLKFDDVTGKDVNLDQLEQVLELLEDFSTIAYTGAVDKRLVWDSSIGWYASRYFLYSLENGSIEAIRTKWCLESETDPTYYENLELLYKNYLAYEEKQVGKKKEHLVKAYMSTKDKFIKAESMDFAISTKVSFKRVSIELRPSKIDGVGVFAIRKINKGQVIAEGVHKDDYDYLVPWEDVKSVDEDIKKKIGDFCIGTEDGFIPPEDFDFKKLSVEWYMNHSCNGNVGFDENGDFVTIRDIEKGQEVTYDYGLAESNPNFKMECNCGDSNCRKIITGNDWNGLELRKNNLMHMLPALRESS